MILKTMEDEVQNITFKSTKIVFSKHDTVFLCVCLMGIRVLFRCLVLNFYFLERAGEGAEGD